MIFNTWHSLGVGLLCVWKAAGRGAEPLTKKILKKIIDWQLGTSLSSQRAKRTSVLRRSRLSPERATRIQPGVSVALPPVIKARVSVYHASAARPAILCGKARTRCLIYHSLFIIGNPLPLPPPTGGGFFIITRLPGGCTPGCILNAPSGLFALTREGCARIQRLQRQQGHQGRAKKECFTLVVHT